MQKLRIIAGGLVGASLITLGAVGLAAADTKHANTAGIPRTVLRSERQAAVAAVLGTSTDAVKTAHHNHAMKDLVSKAGLTEKTFHQKVTSQLTADLKAKGYSDTQISKAERHHHRAHRVDHAKKSAQ